MRSTSKTVAGGIQRVDTDRTVILDDAAPDGTHVSLSSINGAVVTVISRPSLADEGMASPLVNVQPYDTSVAANAAKSVNLIDWQATWGKVGNEWIVRAGAVRAAGSAATEFASDTETAAAAITNKALQPENMRNVWFPLGDAAGEVKGTAAYEALMPDPVPIPIGAFLTMTNSAGLADKPSTRHFFRGLESDGTTAVWVDANINTGVNS